MPKIIVQPQLAAVSPTILILDSGVGGLSIYQAIRQRLPQCHFIYAFDNAAFPYGEKSEAVILQRVSALIAAIHHRCPVQLVVIGCNTASTSTLPILRTRFPFPIVGVVPALKPAARITRNGIIGLLATRATVQRPYIDALIQQFASHCRVERLGSARLVALTEAKLAGQIEVHAALAEILSPWLQRPHAEQPDTIVLGCTHFPLLHQELLAILPLGTTLVDSALGVACQVERLLLAGAVHPEPSSIEIPTKVCRAYCTRLDPQAQALWPMLQRYQFKSLANIDLESLNTAASSGTVEEDCILVSSYFT